MAETKQFATFFVDGLFCGVEAKKVQEIISSQEMTLVPLAADVIRGLINLRGQVVTAIDLRRRLKLAEPTDDITPKHVVVSIDDDAVSLLVDEIGDVIDVDEDAFEAAPETIHQHARNLLHGVYKLEDRLLLALDVERTLDVAGTSEASSGRSH